MTEQYSLEELQAQIAELRSRLAISEETIRAIQGGEVDALVVESAEGAQVFTLTGAEHPYRVLVEEMSQGAATLTMDGTLAFCNLHFAQMLKRPLENLLGSNVADFVSPPDMEVFRSVEARAWTSPARGEVSFTSGDGLTIPIYLAMSCVNIGSDRTLCLVATDLREQKRDEALLAEERLARSIFENAADGILVCDDQGRIIRTSDIAARIAGRQPLFEYVDSLFAFEDDQGHPFSILNALSGGRQRGVILNCGQGKAARFNLLVGIGPIKNELGESLGGVITLTDITERRTFERELALAKKVADDANSAKSNFLANMSHEIRTPLGAILGFTELLKEPEIGIEEKSGFIEVIERNGHALTHLIDDILDLSKVEAGKIVFERIEFSLRSLIGDIHKSLKVIAFDKNIELTFVETGPLPDLVTSDPGRIRQILLNIIGNAIKFTPDGCVTVRIKASPSDTPQTSKLIFLVEDSGCGIAEEHQSMLFQSFVQGDNSTTRKFGGTGLGLALSKRLANALDGDVKLVQSTKGRGSIFEICFAVHVSEQNMVLQSSELKKLRSARTELNGLKVLVADDSADNQTLIRRLLLRSGATVDSAGNGLEAMTQALAVDYDLILMDVQMPVLDGHGATQKLRSLGYQKPIIALTAHAMNEERDKCFRSGYSGFLTKPIDHATLIATVARFAGVLC